MSEFSIECTGDICVGDHIQWTEAVWPSSYARGNRPLGERTISGVVERDSYGHAKQQHTFSIRVTSSEGKYAQDIVVGETIRRKGRNVYRNGTKRQPWPSEIERKGVLEDKHQRGAIARNRAAMRKAGLL